VTTPPPAPELAAVVRPNDEERPAEQAYLGDTTLHRVLLVLSSAVVIASLVLQIRAPEQVVLPLVEVELPGVCSYKQLLGIDCPGCGLTRCFVSMAHGDFARAWQYNPAGIYLFLVVVFQIPYRWIQLRRLRRGQPEYDLGWFTGVALGLLIVALLSQWVVRML
jgi:hypothetical protein